jgi:hypothetical protein
LVNVNLPASALAGFLRIPPDSQKIVLVPLGPTFRRPGQLATEDRVARCGMAGNLLAESIPRVGARRGELDPPYIFYYGFFWLYGNSTRSAFFKYTFSSTSCGKKMP